MGLVSRLDSTNFSAPFVEKLKRTCRIKRNEPETHPDR